jgi:amino-acid N-acetyltransferase
MQYKFITADSTPVRHQVLNLLFENNLPVSDLDEKKTLFALVDTNNNIIGSGGLEYFGDTALIRSVSVKKEWQGRGLGKQIRLELEKIAQQKGVRHLFLLTTTAKGFFEKEEYTVIDRNEVPLTIKETSEFAGVCPTSAFVMRKQLP